MGDEMTMTRHAAVLGLLVAWTFIAPALLAQAQGVATTPDLLVLKRDYRRPSPRPIENGALVDLGRDLFFDPKISASGKTACASCHNPALGYGVTDAHSLYDSGKRTSRKSQPLIGLGYAGKALVVSFTGSPAQLPLIAARNFRPE